MLSLLLCCICTLYNTMYVVASPGQEADKLSQRGHKVSKTRLWQHQQDGSEDKTAFRIEKSSQLC